mmetsp:Transcript_121005/g.353576  ORF Transcript_121005/g.353576 Transcript_121005/m.353576 type:complete len:383 (+) Transcript_121005:74-1222(+)
MLHFRVVMLSILFMAIACPARSERQQGIRGEGGIAVEAAADETLATMPPAWLEYVEVDRTIWGGVAHWASAAGVVDPSVIGRVGLAHDQELGRGGFGRVSSVTFKCDPSFKGAVKEQTFDARNQDIVIAEVKLMTMGIPRILTALAHGVDQASKLHYILTPRADGTLDDLSKLRRAGGMEYVVIFHDLMYGLKAMHESKLVHRDIKPANMFLFCDPHDKNRLCNAVLGDLGLACQTASPGPPHLPPCDQRGVWGTLPFLPPDMRLPGQQTWDKLAKADVFAAGLTMWALMGQPPRGAMGPWSRMESPNGKNFGNHLEYVIFSMMSEDQKQRPSATVALQEVQKIADNIKLSTFARSNGPVENNFPDCADALQVLRSTSPRLP